MTGGARVYARPRRGVVERREHAFGEQTGIIGGKR